MTNSSPLSAPRAALLALSLAALSGCGPGDGSADYRAGCEAYAAGDPAKAARAFGAALVCAPDNVDAHVMLARAEMQLGEFSRAQEALARAVELAGTDADVLELSAQIAYQMQDLPKARAAFASLAEDASRAASVRARGYAGLGAVDYACITPATMDEFAARARTAFLTALRLDYRNAAAHYNLGRLYSDFLHYPEVAQSEFSIFLSLVPPDDARAVRVRDVLMPELKARVEDMLRQHRGSGLPNPAACAAALRSAGDAMAKSQFKTARQHYAAAYAADPTSYPAALGIAQCAAREGTRAGLQDALKYYRIACELRPSASAALVALGDVALRVNSPAVAEKAYSRAVAVCPRDITALRRLEGTLRKYGKAKVADVYKRYYEGLSAGKR